MNKTKGQVEDSLAKAFIQFYVKKLGTGPKSARVYIVEDMILVHLTGRLHPLEDFLLQEKKRRTEKQELLCCGAEYGDDRHHTHIARRGFVEIDTTWLPLVLMARRERKDISERDIGTRYQASGRQ